MVKKTRAQKEAEAKVTAACKKFGVDVKNIEQKFREMNAQASAAGKALRAYASNAAMVRGDDSHYRRLQALSVAARLKRKAAQR